jgi:hypothetical protein
LGNDLLLIPGAPTESDKIHYTVFGNSRVWTIVQGGGRYVAGANNGKIGWSDDGITWTLSDQDVFGNHAVRGIAHNGGSPGIFMAVGQSGRIVRSTDGGETWQNITWETGATLSDDYLTIAFGGTGANARFVAAGDGGEVRASTDNTGATWTTITGWNASRILDVDGNWRPIAVIMHDGTDFVAFNNWPGKHARSASGLSGWQWISDTINGDSNRRVVGGAFGNSRYMILENSGWIGATTTLGGNWSTWADTQGNAALSFSNERFISVGTGSARISENGETWTTLTTGFYSTDVISVAFRLPNGDIILSGNQPAGWGSMRLVKP